MLCLKNSEVCLCVSEWLPKMSAKQAWGLTPSDRSSTPQLFRPLMYFYFAWKKVYAFGNWRVLGGCFYVLSRRSIWAHGMDSSPLVRPRHISISVRPIQNFFMSAVDFEVKLNRSFWQWIQGDGFWRWILKWNLPGAFGDGFKAMAFGDGLKATCLGRGHWKERNIVCWYHLCRNRKNILPSTSYVPTLLRTSSPTSGGPLAPRQLCFDKVCVGLVVVYLIVQ